MKFNPDSCSKCDGKVIDRVPTSFVKIAAEALKKNRRIGDITKEHIEASREDLKEMKEELRTAEHKPDG